MRRAWGCSVIATDGPLGSPAACYRPHGRRGGHRDVVTRYADPVRTSPCGVSVLEYSEMPLHRGMRLRFVFWSSCEHMLHSPCSERKAASESRRVLVAWHEPEPKLERDSPCGIGAHDGLPWSWQEQDSGLTSKPESETPRCCIGTSASYRLSQLWTDPPIFIAQIHSSQSIQEEPTMRGRSMCGRCTPQYRYHVYP